MPPAEATGGEAGAAHDAYAQPTPRLLYVHDDLTEEVATGFGPASAAAALTRSLFELLGQDRERVVILTLEDQLERVIAQGGHAPFDLALGIAAAGERVTHALHARTGWFPRVRRLGLTREEDGRGGYRLVSTVPAALPDQLQGIAECRTLAVVDDTIFSGLTMRGVLEVLSPDLLSRTHAFCLRGVADSIAAVAKLCPLTAGVVAPGRILEDVSFINASGLVRRVSIRPQGRPPLAFFERPEWIRAWFPGRAEEVVTTCRRLNALLEPIA